MSTRIILEGITLEDLLSGVKEVVREEIRQADADKLRPITKKECYTKLGITNKTLDKILRKEGITVLYSSDIEKLRLKYPKYSR